MRTSRTIMWSVVALVCMLFVGTLTGLAQSITTAAVNGRIISKSGDPIPGVTVMAVHNPSGTRYGTSTRIDGRYNLPNLRVGGPYTVSASIVGYQKQSREGIYLQLTQNLDLNFSLGEEAVAGEEVVVIGRPEPIFNSTRTGAATNVTRDKIEQLPTISRNFQDYLKNSPYFSGGNNALGRNAKFNNIQIDGGDFNDLFGLGSTGAPAGQSNVTPISLDAIEEFQVTVSPFDVRQSGFTGAGINAITRSGTNDYKGSLFYYWRNRDFVGKSPDTLKTKLSEFTDYQMGGRAGGPIIENSLFFFANGEVTRFKQPISRIFDPGPNSTETRVMQLGTNAYPANRDSLNMLVNYLKNTYGYDPGAFGSVGNQRESDKFFLRFDLNLNETNKLTARYNYLRSSEDNSPSRGRSLTDIYFDNGKYKLDNKTHSAALQLSSVFGNTASNELIVGYTNQLDVPIYYGKPFPTLYIATRGTGTTYTGAMNLVLGAEEFRHFNELGQKYIEISDNFSWYLPEHTLTIGAKVDLFSFRNLFIPDGFGAYTYGSIAQFLNNQRANSYTFRYSATSNPKQEANWGAKLYGVYAQDEWTVSPALKLTAGVRVDVPTYGDRPNYNFKIDSVFGYRTDTPPKTQYAFSPRLGFNWAVDEERTTQVRGGVGIFYGRFPYVWVSNQYSNTGVDFYTVTSAPTSFIADPYGQPKTATTLPSAEVNLTDPNFKAPSILRYNVAIDHQLPLDFVVTLEGILSSTQNDIYYQNINLRGLQPNAGLSPGGKLTGENRDVYGTYNATTRTFSPVWVNSALFAPGVFLIRNTDQGRNANFTVQVQRNVPGEVSGTVAYTYGVAKDINSGNSTTASSGWRFTPTQGNPNLPALTYSQWDRRHRLMGNVSYRHDWGGGFASTIGVFYNGLSGRPYSFMVTGDVNGDGRSDNDLAYIPRDINDIILVDASNNTLAKSHADYTSLFSFINGEDYLSSHKGQISERSAPREPWAHTLDLHFGQEIPTIAGQRFEVTVDILNVMNLLNNEWGWIRNTGVNQTINFVTFRGLTTAGGADYGKPRYQWTGLKTTDGKADPFTADNIPSRWQMQIGLRYTL